MLNYEQEEMMLPVHIASVQGRTNIITELLDSFGVDKYAADRVSCEAVNYQYTVYVA